MWRKAGRYLSYVVIILYIVIGIMLIATDRFSNLQKEMRVILAIIIFLYAGWRIARIFNAERERRDEEE